MAYQIRSSAYVPAVQRSCFVWRATWISTNQSDEDPHHAPESCTLEVLRVPPKRKFANFYLALFNKINFVLYFENETDTGIYERE